MYRAYISKEVIILGSRKNTEVLTTCLSHNIFRSAECVQILYALSLRIDGTVQHRNTVAVFDTEIMAFTNAYAFYVSSMPSPFHSSNNFSVILEV